MKHIYKLVIFFLLFIAACSTNKPLPIQSGFNLNKYLGKWYEIAHLPFVYQEGCSNTTAYYSLRDDGKLFIVNKCIKNKKVSQSRATGYLTNKLIPNHFKVSFIWPFTGDYQIIYTDYNVSLVGTPNRKYLWILSRKPVISTSQKKDLIKKAKILGFNTSKLIYTKHSTK